MYRPVWYCEVINKIRHCNTLINYFKLFFNDSVIVAVKAGPLSWLANPFHNLFHFVGDVAEEVNPGKLLKVVYTANLCLAAPVDMLEQHADSLVAV